MVFNMENRPLFLVESKYLRLFFIKRIKDELQ